MTVPGSDVLRDPGRALRVAEVLRAVAHPVRLRIVALLGEGDAHVAEIARALRASQASVSQQLRILRLHGLVSATRRNGFARYTLAEPALRDLTRCVERCDGARPPGGRTLLEAEGS
jgi:ArsR family transcriptional regulator